MSYLISFDNTYWLTKGENLLYNKISPIEYNIEQIKQRRRLIWDITKIETQEKDG